MMSDSTPENPPANEPTPSPAPTSTGPSNDDLLSAINSLPDRFAAAMREAFTPPATEATPTAAPVNESPPAPTPEPEPDPTPKSEHWFFKSWGGK